MTPARRKRAFPAAPRAKARAKRRPDRARDTAPSSFAPILADLVARVPGALAAILVDRDGEAVDYSGSIDPFDLKLAGAHWQIVLAELQRAFTAAAASLAGRPRTLVVRGARRSFVARVLPEEYALILLLSRRAGFTYAPRAFSVCERALAHEAGWAVRARGTWFPHAVVAGRAGRPSRLRAGSHEHSVEILGQLARSHSAPRERGWRVRLENGAEFTLVREPGGRWYADEPIEALVPPNAHR